MSTFNRRLAIAVAAAFLPSVAWAQHEAHQAGAQHAPSADVSQCLRVQPVIANIVTAAMARAEAARLSNNPVEMRAALDHLDAALRDIRAQSAPCAAAAAAADPHAGHAMPRAQPPAGTPPAQTPAAVDPHAGHTATPKPATRAPKQPAPDPHARHTAPGAAAATTTTKSSKPPAPKKEESAKTADPHAGHAPAKPPADKQMDPVNGLMVDPAKAPKATYQGRTYYFSSEQSRKEFLDNPAKFVKKPKE